MKADIAEFIFNTQKSMMRKWKIKGNEKAAARYQSDYKSKLYLLLLLLLYFSFL